MKKDYNIQNGNCDIKERIESESEISVFYLGPKHFRSEHQLHMIRPQNVVFAILCTTFVFFSLLKKESESHFLIKISFEC